MRTVEQFYQDLEFFKHACYTQKIEFMRKNWGNVLYDMIIFYTDNHTVSINIDANKKYTFTFNITKVTFDEIEEYMPNYSEMIESGNIEELKKFDKNLEDISYFPIEDLEENVKHIEETEIFKETNNIIPFYINLYNQNLQTS